MLIVNRGTRSCKSCRSQFFFLFEHFLVSSSHLSQLARIRRYATHTYHLYPQRPLRRTISTTRRDLGEVHEGERGAPSNEEASDIEETVRNARATFGDTLPKDYLSETEYLLYERLYGPPTRETRGDDFETLGEHGNERLMEGNGNTLLRENAKGELEEVEFKPGDDPRQYFTGDTTSGGKEMGPNVSVPGSLVAENQLENSSVDTIQVRVTSQRAADAIIRLQRDMEAAFARPDEEEGNNDEESLDEEQEEEDIEDDHETDAYVTSESTRTHPYTEAGRFGTFPSTLTLPKEHLVNPVSELLARVNNKHLTDAAITAFGGPTLPFSSATPEIKKTLSKHIGLEAGQHSMSEIEADAYLGAILPGVYSAAMSTIVEIRKRLGTSWIRNLFARNGGEGPRILDAGGAGAGIIAWRQILAAESDTMRLEGLLDPSSPISKGKSTVLVGPSTLRHRMSSLLDNTTFLPRLPDYVHSANSESLLYGAPAGKRKSYDIIFASHLLLPLKDDHKRKHVVRNLWSLLDPNGGVLILVEKGIPSGFEAIAGARALLLKNHISSPGSTHIAPLTESSAISPTAKEAGMIIAPCTNHAQCPMYKIEGRNPARKDFCHFSQRFARPTFLQTLLGPRAKNYEDLKFSYIAVQRGIDLRDSSKFHSLPEQSSPIIQDEEATKSAFVGYEALDRKFDKGESMPVPGAVFSPFSLPRTILPPLKRRGHVILDVCTPSGSLERWTVPRSFSSQAFRDARKSSHGDLWALGAKTRILREPRLGRLNPDGTVHIKGYKSKEKNRRKKEKNVFEVEMGERGMEGMREVVGGKMERGWEKRTKRGRAFRRPGKINLDDIEDDDD